MSDITLGGRHFTPIVFERRTVLIDHYLQRLVRACALDTILPVEGEPDQGWFMRLQAALIESGRAHEIIAGYLLPLGRTERDWTPELAAETAKHIALCDTAEDRALVQELAAEVVVAFFGQRMASLLTFLSSLNASQASPKSSVAPPAASSSAVRGMRSFAKWLDMTMTGRWSSLAGRSARS